MDRKPSQLRIKAYCSSLARGYQVLSTSKNMMSIFCGLLVVLAFSFSVFSALKLEIHKEVTLGITSTIPPALSRIQYGHDKHYMSLKVVDESFTRQLEKLGNRWGPRFSSQTLDLAIANTILENQSIKDHSDRVLFTDDKGFVLFTEMAFKIFGYKIEGLFYLYYIILSISSAIFIFAYWKNPSALALLATFLTLHGMTLPLIKYDPALISVLNFRCLPLLAMIACIHCLIYIFDPILNWGKVTALAVQAAIIIFTISLRSSAIWIAFTVLVTSFIFLCFKKNLPTFKLSRPKFYNRFLTAIPLALVLCFFVLLNMYRAADFPEEYYRSETMVTRPIWPSIFMGFAHNPSFAKRFNPELRIDDVSAILAVKQYLIERGREDEWMEMGGKIPPGYTSMQWPAVDKAAKEMLFTRCQEHFSECFTAIFYFKPISMFKTILWACGIVSLPPDIDLFTSPYVGTGGRDEFLETSRQLDLHNDRSGLWLSGVVLISIVLVAIFTLRRNCSKEITSLLCVACILALGSSAPSILGFPAPHTITEAVIAIPLLIVFLFAYFVSKIIRSIIQK